MFDALQRTGIHIHLNSIRPSSLVTNGHLIGRLASGLLYNMWHIPLECDSRDTVLRCQGHPTPHLIAWQIAAQLAGSAQFLYCPGFGLHTIIASLIVPIWTISRICIRIIVIVISTTENANASINIRTRGVLCRTWRSLIARFWFGWSLTCG